MEYFPLLIGFWLICGVTQVAMFEDKDVDEMIEDEGIWWSVYVFTFVILAGPILLYLVYKDRKEIDWSENYFFRRFPWEKAKDKNISKKQMRDIFFWVLLGVLLPHTILFELGIIPYGRESDFAPEFLIMTGMIGVLAIASTPEKKSSP